MQLFALKIHVTKPNFMENSGIPLYFSFYGKLPSPQVDPHCNGMLVYRLAKRRQLLAPILFGNGKKYWLPTKFKCQSYVQVHV